MMSAASVIAGSSPQSALLCAGKSGDEPYSMMPGRIQSPRHAGRSVAKRKVAALLQSERAPASSAAAASKLASWRARPASGPATAASASARCVISEMLVDLRQTGQPQPGRAVGLRTEAEPVHAAVELQEHVVRRVRLVRREHVDLRCMVHGVPQVQARADLEVARLEAAFEQQDRPAPAERAQPFGLVQVEQRKAVGALQPGDRRARCHGRRRWP